MKYHLKSFLYAVLAGVCIGIGGAVNLSVENTVVGAFLFSIGLIMICVNGFNLFTGKVGYLPDQKPSYLLFLLTVWLGNLAGTALVGYALRLTRVGISGEGARVYAMVQTKLDDHPLSVFILAFFCGILMYLAVNGYRRIEHHVGKYIALILPVAVFILCGFEHCVANMFYFSVANAWGDPKAWGWIGIMTLGNACGSVVFRLTEKLGRQD